MKVKFIHTADWQLGKGFSAISDPDKRATVRRKRIESLASIGKVARENNAEFILVAGDVFDSFRPKMDVVVHSLEAIRRMELPVYAIPGNHDHGGPGGPWTQDYFIRKSKELAPNFHILTEREKPLELDSAIIYPCPLLSQHEPGDPTQWLRQVDDDSGKVQILLAHGTIQDFGSDKDEESLEYRAHNHIDLTRLPEESFDYMALGDWHGLKKVGNKAWYSGTHETDRFPKTAEYNSGNVLLVEAQRSKLPKVSEIPTGSLKWLVEAFQFHEDTDVEILKKKIQDKISDNSGAALLQLAVSGHISLSAHARLKDLLNTWEAGLLRFKMTGDVSITPTEEDLIILTQCENPLVTNVARQLIEKLQGPEAEIARAALTLLYNKMEQTS